MNTPPSTPPVISDVIERPNLLLQPSEAFNLLYDQDALNKKVIQAGSLHELCGDQLAEAYYFCKCLPEADIIARFEMQRSIPCALAILLGDPSEASFHKLCRALRRALYYTSQKRILRRERWERDTSKHIIEELGTNLSIFNPQFGRLAAFYDENYAEKNYEDIRDDTQDNEYRLRVGHTEGFDLSSMHNLVQRGAAATVAAHIKFLFGAHERAKGMPDNQARIIEELKQSCSRIAGPEDIFSITSILVSAPEHLNSVTRSAFTEGLSRFLKRHENMWNTAVWDAIQGGNLRDAILNISRRDIYDLDAARRNDFVESFINEPDCAKASEVTAHIPPGLRGYIGQALLERDFAASPLSYKLAILARDDKFLYEELVPHVVEKPHMRNSVIGVVELARGSDGAQNFRERCDTLHGSIERDRKRHRDEREERIRRYREEAASAANGAVTPDAKRASPVEKLERGSFAELMRMRIAVLQLPQDIAYRALNVRSLRASLERNIAGIAGNEELLKTLLDEHGEMTIETEASSFLRKIGVSQVRFKRTSSFEVGLVCDPKKQYTGVTIDDIGLCSMRGLPPDLGWLRTVIETEVTRLFFKKLNFDTEITGFDYDALLTLLMPPEILEEPQPEQPEQPEPSPQLTEESQTRDLMMHNFNVFERWLRQLRSVLDLPDSFNDHLEKFVERQRSIRVSKQIPPGGVRVIVPERDQFAPFIEGIDIYNALESRRVINSLGIDLQLFHGFTERSEREMDFYLAAVHVRIGSEKQTFYSIIIPPHFNIYVIGVDPQKVFEDEDSFVLAVYGALLESFKMAVMRSDDPQQRKSSRGLGVIGGGNGWNDHVRDVITEMTQNAYPPVVVEWDTVTTPRVPHPPRPQGRPDEMFLKIATTQGDLSNTLASHGCFMTADDYLQLVPGAAQIFPLEAYVEIDGKSYLRKDYTNIYIPLDNPEIINYLLNRRVVVMRSIADIDKFERWFIENLEKYPDETSGAIFERGLSSVFSIDPYFQNLCQMLFTDPKSQIRSYRELFDVVAARARRDAPNIQSLDIFSAFCRMSVLNPEKLIIAVSGAAGYRLPYLYREGGHETPEERIFEAGDFDVSSITDLDVVKIIADNRARFSMLSQTWLRGSERTDAIDFAARIQSHYRSDVAGQEIALAPRSRALLVFEFGDSTHAFIYLDTASSSQLLTRVYPYVRANILRAVRENASGTHTDFTNWQQWSTKDLVYLEQKGVIALQRDQFNRICGIQWSKRIKRKKIVIFTEEQVGYRQFQFEPANFAQYMQFCYANGVDLPEGFPDPHIASIQKIFYEVVGM